LDATVLVTGAAGFAGVHVAQELARAGARLVLQDNAYRRQDLLAPVLAGGRATFIVCALEALETAPALLNELGRADYVVHLPGTGDEGEPAGSEAALAGFAALLARLPRHLRGVCLGSTLSAFDGGGEPIGEACRAFAQHAAAQSALRLEAALADFGRQRGVPVTTLRFSTLFGPGEAASTRVVPALIRSLLAEQPPVIYGDGGDVNDYLFVRDAARAVRLALERQAPGRSLFHIGTGYGWTTRAVAETLQRLLIASAPLRHMPARTDRQGWVADPAAARARLGFAAETDLETGLRAEINYARAYHGAAAPGAPATWTLKPGPLPASQ
jgi:UDP-glucose 4-epimerase